MYLANYVVYTTAGLLLVLERFHKSNPTLNENNQKYKKCLKDGNI